MAYLGIEGALGCHSGSLCSLQRILMMDSIVRGLVSMPSHMLLLFPLGVQENYLAVGPPPPPCSAYWPLVFYLEL